MLSAAQMRATQHRRRSPYSDKQYYQEYILQRIEGYKNSIGRDELLRLGDEAAAELQTRGRGAVPPDRSPHARVGGPAHHEATLAPALQQVAAPVPQAARGAAHADPLGTRARLPARPGCSRDSSPATSTLVIGSAAEACGLPAGGARRGRHVSRRRPGLRRAGRVPDGSGRRSAACSRATWRRPARRLPDFVDFGDATRSRGARSRRADRSEAPSAAWSSSRDLQRRSRPGARACPPADLHVARARNPARVLRRVDGRGRGPAAPTQRARAGDRRDSCSPCPLCPPDTSAPGVHRVITTQWNRGQTSNILRRLMFRQAPRAARGVPSPIHVSRVTLDGEDRHHESISASSSSRHPPLGIVIKSGAPAPKPVRFWAYMWAADEEAGEDHWHQHVPTEHAA